MKKRQRFQEKAPKKQRKLPYQAWTSLKRKKREKEVGGMKRVRYVWPYLKGTKEERNKGKEESLFKKAKTSSSCLHPYHQVSPPVGPIFHEESVANTENHS